MTLDRTSMDEAKLPGDEFASSSTRQPSAHSPKKRKLNDGAGETLLIGESLLVEDLTDLSNRRCPSRDQRVQVPPHLATLRSVLGDGVNLDTLGKLWARSGKSLERAVNAFFDGSFSEAERSERAQYAPTSAPAGASSRTGSEVPPSPENLLLLDVAPSIQQSLRTGVSASAPLGRQAQPTAFHGLQPPAAESEPLRQPPDAYYVGGFMVAGYATTKGRNLLSAGEQVYIERDKLAARKHTPKKRSAPARSSYLSTVSNRHRNLIVRFTNSRRFEVGRLPAEDARFVSTLLDQGLFAFTGSVIYAPEILLTGENILLQVRAYIKREAFKRFSRDAQDEEKVSVLSHTSSDLANHPDDRRPHPLRSYLAQAASASQMEVKDQDQKDQELKMLRMAMLSLIQRCGLKPTMSGAAAAKISGSDADSKAALRAAIADATKRPKSAPASASFGGVDSHDNEISGDEGKEVSEADLSMLYTRAQRLDLALPKMEPPEEFSLTLRGYQRQALAWMYAKETESRGVLEGQTATGSALARSREAMIHPLWEEYAFGGDENNNLPPEAPSKWYFNPYSGEMSFAFPHSEDRARGGILADEMGLGKTIEILALVHSNQADEPLISKKQCKATLVVCPMSLLAQWRDESAIACPSLKCDMYYGSSRDSTARFDSVDIVITSYGTLASEFASWVGDDGLRKGAAPPLYAVEFHRVVLDEAHQIKNRLSRAAKACYAVEARRRWCVTGTPIQNKLEDLFSLVHFLRVEPWSNISFWKAHITIPFEENKDHRAIQTVQKVLEPIILMRTKDMKDANGRSIIELPQKEILIEHLDFSEQERDIYDSLYRDSKTKFNTYCAAGKVLSHFASIFQLLMRLRQVCDHPVLALGGSKDLKLSNPDGSVDIHELIARFTSEGDSQDGGDQASKEGGTAAFAQSVIERLMRDAEADKSGQSNECAICFELSINPVLMTTCLHTACRDCVMAYLQKRDDQGKDGECPICRKPLTAKDLLDVVRKRKDQSSGNDEDDGGSSSSTFSTVDLRRNSFRSSTKLDALVSHLKSKREQGPAGNGRVTRSVVFSQFTSMLDLVEIMLAKNDIPFGRLDGTMNQRQREKVLESFKKSAKGGAEVLLVSLRAGGVGLNLTSASEVYVMDPWWNFEIEKQAIDRVHRIGQTQKVTVRRFIIRNTVEERMLTIQERKSALAGGALGLNREEAKGRRLEELMILFK